jgi:UDP-N-acetylmuramyl pentapeptide phosphotransferase/UDP-N-acetylglucosamine-1-phosphate transferase
MVFAVAAVVALVSTYALIGLMLPYLRQRAMAQLTRRSSHKIPTPQGAGLAIVVVTLTIGAALCAAGYLPLVSQAPEIAVLTVGAVVLCAIGLMDDIVGLPIRLRLLGQTVAVVALVVALPAHFRILPGYMSLAPERLFVALAGVWFVNLFNFMDGIDWISFVEVTTIAGGVTALWLTGLIGGPAGPVSLILLAATAGFAAWNKPRAIVFMGDAGSLPVGLMLVWLMIELAARGAWAAAILFPLYYWADASVTLVVRIKRRERFWNAHREHFYQQATRPGRWTVPQTLARIAILNIFLAALGFEAELSGDGIAKLAAIGLGTIATAILLYGLADRRADVGVSLDG